MAREHGEGTWRLLPDEASHGTQLLPLHSTYVRLRRVSDRMGFSLINRMALR